MGHTAVSEADGRWAERTYEAMAPVYDDFTAHHEYDLWTADLLEILERHGLSGRRLLDVGCGTGKSFLEMLPRGWQVTACDLSPAMVAIAREKAGDAVDLSVADMRELPVFGEFDLVWALDDAVNYLLDGDELRAALAGMRANLAPGGLLLFDLNSLLAYRTFFAETEVVERNGRRLVWTGLASADVAPGSICESRLEVQLPDGTPAPEEEPLFHRQRHFPEAEVLAAFADAGLERVDVYGLDEAGAPRRPLDEAIHKKVLYLARRAA
ncbi:MAG: class I SAM-dependent methyltransferase [Chloroflexota bacterium]